MSTPGNLLSGFKPNKNLTVFMICMVMAALFWLLNALSKPYVVAISVPLEYTGLPEDRIIVNNPVKLVQVRVEGEGYSLLGMGDDQHSPAKIDLSGMFSTQSAQLQHATVTTKHLQRQIQDEVGSSIRILGISHDSIRVDAEPLTEKALPVIPAISITPEPGYVVTAIQVEPARVNVSGPKSMMDTLKAYRFAHQLNDQLKEDYTFSLRPKSANLLSALPEELQINVKIEQLTEGIFSVPVSALHVPDSLAINLYPANVEVTFTAPVSKFDSISVQDFRAVVDYKSVKTNEIQKLRVRLIPPQGDVELIDYRPKRLEYIVRRL